MLSDKFLFNEDDLEYIVEKGNKKAVIIKINQFNRLKSIFELESTEKKNGASALWNLIIETENGFFKDSITPEKNISGRYKSHLYGKDGILK